MNRFVGKGNSRPLDQRNLLYINLMYLQVQMLSKCLLVLFLLATNVNVFNNLLFVTKLAEMFSVLLQSWWHCLQAVSGLGG